MQASEVQSLVASAVSADHIRREQQRDEFAKELLRRLQESGQEYVERVEGTAPRSGAKLRIAKFAELDGLLFRITEASDPREGFDSTRVYVPFARAAYGSGDPPGPHHCR